jgi:hypothetical protein
MKRLFTFGCSFTQYKWPTWADILGREFDYYENWGKQGAGNQYIFHSLIECNQRHQFNKNDTIVVMWTESLREDRYVKDQWIVSGNVNLHLVYDKEWVRKFYCPRGHTIRDLSLITATISVLANTNYIFLSMTDIDAMDTDVQELYSGTLSSIRPSAYKTLFNGKWGSRPSQFAESSPEKKFFLHNSKRDFHPSPEEYIEYLNKVLPEISLTEETIQWAKEYKINDWFDRHYPRDRF